MYRSRPGGYGFRKMGEPLFGALELVKGVGTKLLVSSDDLFMSLLTH